jgi:hypothetical protein
VWAPPQIVRSLRASREQRLERIRVERRGHTRCDERLARILAPQCGCWGPSSKPTRRRAHE